MTSKDIVEDFVRDTNICPGDLVSLLTDWFDEHDEAESLREYLAFCREERRSV